MLKEVVNLSETSGN